jgi:hypothetical protein
MVAVKQINNSFLISFCVSEQRKAGNDGIKKYSFSISWQGEHF